MTRVKKEIGKKLKFLRWDRGGEFIYNEFNEFYNEKEIPTLLQIVEYQKLKITKTGDVNVTSVIEDTSVKQLGEALM